METGSFGGRRGYEGGTCQITGDMAMSIIPKPLEAGVETLSPGAQGAGWRVGDEVYRDFHNVGIYPLEPDFLRCGCRQGKTCSVFGARLQSACLW